MTLEKADLDKKLTELRQQHTQAFAQLHQIEGAIKVLEFILAQPDEAPEPPAQPEVKE